MARSAKTAFLACAMLLACAVGVWGAGVASETSIVVDIGTEQVPLTVEAGVDFVDAAAAFCDHYSLDKSMNGPRLVAALEQESARQNVAAVAAPAAAPQPVVSLPLVVNEQNVDLQVFAGQDPAQVVREFAARHRLTDADVNYVYQALMQEVRSLTQQARIVATVSVDIDLGNGRVRSVPMYVRENQTPEDAATAFASTHDLPARNVPTLVAAIQRQLAPRPVFTVPLVVDGTPRELTLHENEYVDSAADSFCSGYGIEAEECKKVRRAILRRLQQFQSGEDLAAAPAPAPAPAPVPSRPGVVSVIVGANTFDVEFEAGVTANVLARHFCREQLPAVRATLAQQGAGEVTMDDCVAVLTHELRRNNLVV